MTSTCLLSLSETISAQKLSLRGGLEMRQTPQKVGGAILECADMSAL